MSSNVSKDIYALENNYSEVIFSQKRPPLDFELNSLQKIQSDKRKQFNRAAVYDGPYGDGFFVETTGNQNEILIRRGLLICNGTNLYLPEDKVISNLSTPATLTREDLVYVEYHYREVDALEDPDLIDYQNIGIETATRSKLEINIFVAEGGFIPTPASGHKQYVIARLNRKNIEPIVDGNTIQDLRFISGQNYVATGGRISKSSGLNFYFEGASGMVGNRMYKVPSVLASIGSNETRYAYIDLNRSFVIAASLPTTYHVPLAKLKSDGSDITQIEDLRRFTAIAGNNLGAQTIFEVITLNNIQDNEVVRVSGVHTVDLADASSEPSMPAWGLSLDSGSAGSTIRVLVSGTVSNTNWSFTPGAQLYGSTAPGVITEVPPSNSGEVVQKLGIALSANQIWFSPDLTYDIVGGIAMHAQNTDIGTTNESFVLRLGQGPLNTSSGLYVNRGQGIPDVGIRFSGLAWEFTNNGNTWHPLCESCGGGGGGQTVVTDSTFRHNAVGNGVQTVFSVPTYSVGSDGLLVFSGTTLMTKGTDYVETDVNTVTFVSPPLSNERISFIGLDTINTTIYREDTAGDGANTSFVLTNPYVDDTAHLLVFSGTTLLTLPSDYTEVDSQTVSFSSAPLMGEVISFLNLGDGFLRHNTTGNGMQTSYSLPFQYSNDGEHLLVFSGTTLLTPGIDYIETSNTGIAFNIAPLNNEVISFIALGVTATNVITIYHSYDVFIGNGFTNTFSLSHFPETDSVMVAVGGIVMTPGEDYTVNGNSVALTSTPLSTMRVVVHYSYS